MKESSLAATIDTLAQRKADEFIGHVRAAITNALKDSWRPKVAGSEAFVGEDIQNVLVAYAAAVGKSDSYKPPKPTNDLVNNCRATIVDDLLKGLPKLRELAMMQEE